MGPILSGPLREVVDLGNSNIVWVIIWVQNKAIDIGEWSIWGCGRLESLFYYISFVGLMLCSALKQHSGARVY